MQIAVVGVVDIDPAAVGIGVAVAAGIEASAFVPVLAAAPVPGLEIGRDGSLETPQEIEDFEP